MIPTEILTGGNFKKVLSYTLKVWVSSIIISPFIVETILYIRSTFTGRYDPGIALMFGLASIYFSIPALLITLAVIFLLNRTTNTYKTKVYLSFIVLVIILIVMILFFAAISSEGSLLFGIPWFVVYPFVSLSFIWCYKLPNPVTTIQIPASDQ